MNKEDFAMPKFYAPILIERRRKKVNFVYHNREMSEVYYLWKKE